MVQSNLCETCLNIPLGLFLPENITSSYPFGTLGDVCQRGKSGCPLCTIAEDALSSQPTDSFESQPGEKNTIEIRVEREGSTEQDLRAWLAFYVKSHRLCRLRATASQIEQRKVYTEECASRRETPRRRPLAVEADDWRNSHLINYWLAECRKRHKDCHQTMFFHGARGSFKMPTRMIDVDRCVNGINPRLITTKSLGEAVISYTALSHAWGDLKIIPKCKKANIKAFHNEIYFEKLPKRYQDAIEVTRLLDLRYIWIDSLCIVQDDEEDIARELERASQVYSNAACTISASDSRTAIEGCFLPRPQREPRLLSEAYILFRPEDRVPRSTVVTIWPHIDSFTEAIQAGKMSTRGWCFQERELSPRIIHFTRKRLLWECREAIAFEDEPEFKGKLHIHESLFSSVRSFDCTGTFTDLTRSKALAQRMSANTDYSFVHWLGRWYSVVEAFSRRDVTFIQDRLNALSAFAEAIGNFLRPHDRYLAGIWYTGLPYHLFWIPHGNAPSKVPPKGSQWPPPLKSPPPNSATHQRDLRLPSWSWISVDGPVLYPYAKTFQPGTSYPFKEGRHIGAPLSLLEIIPRAERAGVDLCHAALPFGAVSSGFITITGHAFEMIMSEANLSSSPGPPHAPKCYWIFNRTVFFGNLWRRDSSVDPSYTGVVYFDSTPYKLPRLTLVFLRLGSGRSLLSGKPVELGLVLLNTHECVPPGIGGPLFRRVGIFEIGFFNRKFWKATRIQEISIV